MNILVLQNYRLTGGFLDNAKIDFNADIYPQMLALCRQSYQKNLVGLDEIVTLTSDYSHLGTDQGVHAMYRNTFRELHELWKEGHNCLLVDSDTLCVKKTDMFDMRGLRLFWHTDPAENEIFNPYLNMGVTYLGSDMPSLMWDLLLERAEGFNCWDSSQRAFNEAFYTQNPLPELRPELNWQVKVSNPVPREDAKIIHFLSTRGARLALEAMQEEWK